MTFGSSRKDTTKQTPLPLFYRDPIVLRAGQHHKSGLLEAKGFDFAWEAVGVPIGISEFALAARHYPIVFSAADFLPLAILGVKLGTKLFIEPDGSWRWGHYVPGYIRRYPFIMTAIPDRIVRSNEQKRMA
jgi:hypothetical protein